MFSAVAMQFAPAHRRERHLVTNKAVLSWNELLEWSGAGTWKGC